MPEPSPQEAPPPGVTSPNVSAPGASAPEPAAPQTPSPDAPPQRPCAIPHPEFLHPVPPITTPPEPSQMIGRVTELTALARALLPQPDSRSPSLAVVEGAPGTGRRRLLQEYVRGYGHRHGFVHWIDARDDASLDEGLAALDAALGTPSPPHGTWDALALHPDWLLVFDDVPSHRWSLSRGLPPLPTRGQGAVIVATDTADDRLHRTSRVIRLGPLTPAEIAEHIKAVAGPELLALDRGTPTRLSELADRLPTAPTELAAVDVRARYAQELGAAATP